MDDLLVAVEQLESVQQRGPNVGASDGATGDSGDTNDGG